MRTLLGILVVIVVYVIVYYRLMVKYYYEREHGVRESIFGALFSFPPYSLLPDKGRIYARRYWVAVAALLAIIAILVAITDFSRFAQAFRGG